MAGHVVPPKTYFFVFAALMGLTALTTGVAFIDLGPWNTVLALAIAVTKMLLVILFFMHVRYSSQLTKVIIVAAFFWLAILVTLTLSDVFTRHWTPIPAGWNTPAASAAPAGLRVQLAFRRFRFVLFSWAGEPETGPKVPWITSLRVDWTALATDRAFGLKVSAQWRCDARSMLRGADTKSHRNGGRIDDAQLCRNRVSAS